MDNCLFCKIVAGEIPAEKEAENDLVMAFRDINPKAPVHVLVIPKIHRTRPTDLTAEEITAMLTMADNVADKLGVKETGVRLVFNVGRHAGQEIDHVHLHMLGGQAARAMY